jgi:hypothetical protein
METRELLAHQKVLIEKLAAENRWLLKSFIISALVAGASILANLFLIDMAFLP